MGSDPRPRLPCGQGMFQIRVMGDMFFWALNKWISPVVQAHCGEQTLPKRDREVVQINPAIGGKALTVKPQPQRLDSLVSQSHPMYQSPGARCPKAGRASA